jgi:hypothetical protein
MSLIIVTSSSTTRTTIPVSSLYRPLVILTWSPFLNRFRRLRTGTSSLCPFKPAYDETIVAIWLTTDSTDPYTPACSPSNTSTMSPGAKVDNFEAALIPAASEERSIPSVLSVPAANLVISSNVGLTSLVIRAVIRKSLTR